VAFYRGISTAIEVWYTSEIYNHCFLILPCTFYFIYQKKAKLAVQQFNPNLWLLLPFTLLLFIQVFAQTGDIKILMHIATFTALPLMIWLVWGNKSSREVYFPLFIMLFSIPVGDQLIPYLQELTTDIAVPLLEFTNVPIYRNGLYLDIPEGRFLVAEACSGISFLITSIAFGFIYSYVSFTSTKKRLVFIAISIIVPILANALRVYGIILTGHLTNMKYAVGADHLIYGGVFYGIILLLLIMIGERFRDRQIAVESDNEHEKPVTGNRTNYNVLLFIGISISMQQFLFNIVESNIKPVTHWQVSIAVDGLDFHEHDKGRWQPKLINSKYTVKGSISYQSDDVDFYGAYFDEINGELIASQHRFFNDNYWTLLSSATKEIDGTLVNQLKVTSQNGQQRMIYYWYQLDDQAFISASKAKLYQTYQKILGNNFTGSLMMISDVIGNGNDAQDSMNKILKNRPRLINLYYQQLNKLTQ